MTVGSAVSNARGQYDSPSENMFHLRSPTQSESPGRDWQSEADSDSEAAEARARAGIDSDD